MNMLSKPLVFGSESILLKAKTFQVSYFSALDLDAITAIEQRSHPHPWSKKNFESSLKSHHCIGLKCDTDWVAYAVVSFVVGEAELLLFVVDRAWQGEGLASAFLRRLIQQASEFAQSMFLEVRASNQAAIYLYDAVGFNEVGVRPNYYPASSGKKDDAILMALDILPELT